MTDRPVEILIVEDSPDDLELTLDVLKRHNPANRIEVVCDGAEAIDSLFATGPHSDRDTANGPKVVLLDLKLPKVDGLEVRQRAMADPRAKAIPVVVLTSSREERDIVESYQLGVNSYINEPVDFKQFNETVRQLGFCWLLINEPPASLAGHDRVL